MTETSDDELVGRAAEGDEAATAELFRRHYEAAVGFARSLAPCSHQAEDLASEAFLRTLSRIRGGARVRSVRAYLFTAVHNLRRDQLRRKFEMVSMEDSRIEVERLEPADDPVAEAIDRIAFEDLTADLSDAQRRVLRLQVIHGCTNGDVAALLGTTRAAIASLTYRARTALRPPP